MVQFNLPQNSKIEVGKYFKDITNSNNLKKVNLKILREIKGIAQENSGYCTLIKIKDDLKASADIFTIDPIKYKISEKIKKSFDPKRIFNPGKMYSGI